VLVGYGGEKFLFGKAVRGQGDGALAILDDTGKWVIDRCRRSVWRAFTLQPHRSAARQRKGHWRMSPASPLDRVSQVSGNRGRRRAKEPGRRWLTLAALYIL